MPPVSLLGRTPRSDGVHSVGQLVNGQPMIGVQNTSSEKLSLLLLAVPISLQSAMRLMDTNYHCLTIMEALADKP